MTTYWYVSALLAGSVFGGAALSVFFKDNIKRHLPLLLAFGGAFLFSQIVFEALPKLYLEAGDAKQTGLFIILGILLQLSLEASYKGIDHGHYTEGARPFSFQLLISLGLHSFLEGIPLGNNPDLAYGIMAHNLPIAVVLTDILAASKLRRGHVALSLAFFALAGPLAVFSGSSINPDGALYKNLLALTVGLLLHISTVILFEHSAKQQFSPKKIFSLLLGFLLGYLL